MFVSRINNLKWFSVLLLMLPLVGCGGGGSGSGGSERLSWVAPSARTDGSPLSPSEISGYRITYGTQPGVYTNDIFIDDGSASGSKLKGIPSGKYFFVVRTIDSDGRQSDASTEIAISL